MRVQAAILRVLLGASAALTPACSGKSSKSTATATTTTTTTSSGGGSVTVSIAGSDPTLYTLPDSLSFVDATDGGANLTLPDFAANRQKTRFKMKLPSSEVANNIRGILCLLSRSDYLKYIGNGAYAAMIDQGSCFDSGSDPTDRAFRQKQLVRALVNSAVSGGAVTVQMWVDTTTPIYLEATINEGPSATNPLGKFTVNYEQDTDYGGNLTVGAGTDSSSIGVSFYESGVQESSGKAFINALAANLYPVNGSFTKGAYTSRGKLGSTDITYQLAFGGNRILEKGDDGSSQCLHQEVVTKSVTRYGLFNAGDGSAVSFTTDAPFVDAHGTQGFIGYFGPSSNLSIASGDTVRVLTSDGTPSTKYTASFAPGKLWKITNVPLHSADITGINLYSTTGSTTTTVTFDGAAFIATESQSNFILHAGQNYFSSPIGTVIVSTTTSGSSSSVISAIATMERTDVTTTAADLTLHCMTRCPGTSVKDSSSFSTPTYGLANMITYTWSSSNFTLSQGSTAVALDSTAASNSNFESGSLFLDDDYSAASSPKDLYSASTYYVYETGNASYSVETLLKDSAGTYRSFDGPMTSIYVHSLADDVNGDSTFSGKPFVLSYGGFGDLWGLPFTANQTTGYYSPIFSIADGTLVGSSGQYELLGLQGFLTPAAAATSGCTDAGLDPTTAPSLPSAPTLISAKTKPKGTIAVSVSDGAALP